MSGPKGDPGDLTHLKTPGWVPQARERGRVARAPVRVADVKAPGGSKAPAPDRAVILKRIAEGKSPITFDFSNRTIAKNNEELRKQYMAYLDELSKTKAGLQLLAWLDSSPHKTTITFDYKANSNTRSKGEHAWDKKGEPATIAMNPTQKSYAEGRPEKPWMTEREKYGFYHELIHAWHITHGTQATGWTSDTKNSEWQATGLGPYAKSERLSDNVIRAQMGKDPRLDYGLRTY